MGLLIFPLVLAGQENTSQTKAQKKAEKKETQRMEKSRKADIKGKKRHYKIQDRKTRKRMKKHRKQVDRSFVYNKPDFFKMLFDKRQLS
ncbi:MAG: hypothetical protein ACHQNT_09665, partial [Bacteroidia bacterium]